MRSSILNLDNYDSNDDSVDVRKVISKVPAVTLGFWIIKIFATTLGETGGDAVSMSMNLGYLVSTAIFACLFIAAIRAQVAAKKIHPFLYWTTIIASTTVGTTLADLVDRSLGIGYTGGSTLLIVMLAYFYTKISHTVLFWAAFILTRPLGAVVGDFLDKPVAKGGLVAEPLLCYCGTACGNRNLYSSTSTARC